MLRANAAVVRMFKWVSHAPEYVIAMIGCQAGTHRVGRSRRRAHVSSSRMRPLNLLQQAQHVPVLPHQIRATVHDTISEGNLVCVRWSSGQVLLESENPNRAAFGHFRILAREKTIEVRLHLPGIAAPAGVHGDVLLTVHEKRCWRSQHARTRGKFP